MNKFQREMWGYLILLALGSALYLGLGDISLRIVEERQNRWVKTDWYGWDYWIYTKVMFMGLFMGVIGVLGIILKMRFVCDEVVK